ncbi:MAG: hypothetical protein CM15mP59_5880 [Flavobacteriaceae bacterium]|nr:MAG: hypothetical protein CM15mP59_5880 [Flavobacteriaceae bacterium]
MQRINLHFQNDADLYCLPQQRRSNLSPWVASMKELFLNISHLALHNPKLSPHDESFLIMLVLQWLSRYFRFSILQRSYLNYCEKDKGQYDNHKMFLGSGAAFGSKTTFNQLGGFDEGFYAL